MRERHYRLKEAWLSDTHRNVHIEVWVKDCGSPRAFSTQQVLDKDHTDRNYTVHTKKILSQTVMLAVVEYTNEILILPFENIL